MRLKWAFFFGLAALAIYTVAVLPFTLNRSIETRTFRCEVCGQYREEHSEYVGPIPFVGRMRLSHSESDSWRKDHKPVYHGGGFSVLTRPFLSRSGGTIGDGEHLLSSE
jgi:hypothetical protein